LDRSSAITTYARGTEKVVMAMDMFIKIGALKGESRDSKFKDTIDVLAWSWGASNSGSAHSGGGAGSGKANIQDLSLTKYIDASSPALLLACCKGTHIDKATLTMRKAGDKPLEYLVIEFDEVLITSLSTGGSGGEDRLTENVTLNFAKFTLSYTPQDSKGVPGTAVPVNFDVAQNVSV
jgi:type VI secretion system secreted protein Hcp